jgi:hypothetical protein
MAIMAMAATAVQAANINSIASGLWSETTTWKNGVVPGALPNADSARIIGGYTVTLDSSVPNTLGNVLVGRQATGALIITNGANLNLTGGNLESGTGDNGSGTITMYGGSISIIDGGFKVGAGANGANPESSAAIHGGNINLSGFVNVGASANASMTMDGGSILASRLYVGGDGTLFNGSTVLTGGSIEVTHATLGLNINANSTLTMGGTGELILAADNWAAIDAFVAANRIDWANGDLVNTDVGLKTWDNGSGSYLHTDFDEVTNKTNVWVNQTIPEPATLGLVAFAGAAVLIIRRRLLI